MRRRSILFCLCLVLSVSGPVCAQVGLPAAEREKMAQRVDALWGELLDLISGQVWGAPEWARGIVLGVRLLAVGPEGIDLMGSRFARADTPEAAFISAVFLAVHGTPTERWFIRRELETNPEKRAWLRTALGSGRAITDTLAQGARWERATDYLPSSTGCRLLARECLRSQDVLVRRGGLLWGFWVRDQAYWRDVQRCARTDPDVLTRRFAAALIKRASGQ